MCIRATPAWCPARQGEGRRQPRVAAVAGAALLRRPLATGPVSYTHLRAHETVLDLVCRLLLEKKTSTRTIDYYNTYN